MSYRVGFFATVFVLIACTASVFGLFGTGIVDLIYLQIIEKDYLDPPQSLSRPYTDTLPPEYYQDADVLLYSYDKHVESIDDFERWKNLVLSRHATDPVITAPGDVTPELISSKDRDGYTLEKYSIPSTGVGDGLFYKLVPDVPSDKAILVLSGTGDQGFNDVAGEPSEWSGDYYQDEIGRKLALAEYTVYAPEWYGYGERSVNFSSCKIHKPDCNGATLITSISQYGISLGGFWTSDLSRITSVIDSEFDRVGIAGLSLGGSASVHTALNYPETYDAVATASGHFSTHDQYAMIGFSNPWMEYYQFRDLLALFAPKPLYTSAGIQELHVTNFEAVTNYSSDYVRGAYALHGAEDNYVNVIHTGAHSYDTESLIEFFDDFL